MGLEDSACCRATMKPHYWARTVEPVLCSERTTAKRSLSTAARNSPSAPQLEEVGKDTKGQANKSALYDCVTVFLSGCSQHWLCMVSANTEQPEACGSPHSPMMAFPAVSASWAPSRSEPQGSLPCSSWEIRSGLDPGTPAPEERGNGWSARARLASHSRGSLGLGG